MGEQFEKVPTALATDTTLSLQARAVYPILLAEAWQRGARAGEQVELPAIRELAVVCGCSMTALKGYIRELSDAAWIWTTRPARGKPQRYVIRASRGSESAPRPEKCGSDSDPGVGRNPTHSRARDSSLRLGADGELAAPPAAVKIEGRNLPVDALAEVCGVNLVNRAKARELAGALREIRQYVWDDLRPEVRVEMYASPQTFERRLAATIRDRAVAYGKALRGARITAPALAKWWHDVVSSGAPGVSDADRQMLDDLPDL